MTKVKNKISLVINTKNEEKNIKDCILSAKPIVDEIIVVDMVSKDRTVEIAEKLGAKVFKVKDYGYVEPARNFALSKPTKEWTLVIDGDERLTESVRKKIIQLVKDKKYDGFNFPFKNIILGKWIKHSMWWPDYQLRLFKTGHMDWPIQVHHKQIFRGEVLDLPPKEENAFLHYNFADIKEIVEMVDHYSSAEKVFQSKKNPTALDLIRYLDSEFRWRYFEHQGYLDGMHGFIMAKFMNYYRFLEVAKYWEKTGYKEIFTPMQLKKAIEDYYNQSPFNEDYYKDKIVKLEADLQKIQSAKFYKLWQNYCKIRDIFLKNFKSQ